MEIRSRLLRAGVFVFVVLASLAMTGSRSVAASDGAWAAEGAGGPALGAVEAQPVARCPHAEFDPLVVSGLSTWGTIDANLECDGYPLAPCRGGGAV